MAAEGLPRERLEQLAARHGLTGHQREQLARLLSLLAADRHAPTSVRRPGEAVDVHLADALTALELERVRAAGRIVDVGAGAGFPGLALAVALPASEVWLLDAQARKCAFLAHAVEELGLANARVACARAEEWRAGFEANDLAVARAVAAMPVVLEYTAPLLRRGGHHVQWSGRRSPGEEETALRAANELGLHREEVRRVEPFPDARAHHLHVFAKVSATPARFPRRPGIARKRPLGA